MTFICFFNQMKYREDDIQMLTTVEGLDVSCVTWLDNEQVMLIVLFYWKESGK